MSLAPLPERVVPYKLGSRKAAVQGTVPLGRMVRLGKYLSSPAGEAEVDLVFNLDNESRCLIRGSVESELTVLCQRCLGETHVRVASTLEIVVDDVGETIDESGGPDVVTTDEGELDLLALVEDELILSLPIVVFHERGDCNQTLNDLQAEAARDQTENKPFAALQALKGKLKK